MSIDISLLRQIEKVYVSPDETVAVRVGTLRALLDVCESVFEYEHEDGCGDSEAVADANHRLLAVARKHSPIYQAYLDAKQRATPKP